MDSLTQIVLGAACGEAVLGRKIGNKALLFGAIGGTIPDLDVFVGRWLYSNNIQAMAFHRGFMHSFLFSIIASVVLGFVVFWWYQRRNSETNTSKQDWIMLFLLSVGTHPILDSFTGYGTQLFAPFSNYRVAFDNIAVVDPLYTIPFLLCLIIMMFFKRSSKSRRLLLYSGIAVSSFYLCFTLINKVYINSIFISDLDEKKIEYHRFKSQPTILNNILWYGIAETEQDFHVAFYSIFDKDSKPRVWHRIPKNHNLVLDKDQNFKTLEWFSDGFYGLSKSKEKALIFKDLRYPLLNENDPNSSVFTFKIIKTQSGWEAAPFEPKQPRRKDFLEFWERLKGI